MSWIGLTYKRAGPIFPHEWNALVDALDILKEGVDKAVKVEDLPSLPSHVGPTSDNTFDLGFPDRRWRSVYAVSGFFANSLYVEGKPVLKDGDPVYVAGFVPPADAWAARVDRATRLYVFEKPVGTVSDRLAYPGTYGKRWHIRVPVESPYTVYVGPYGYEAYPVYPTEEVVIEIWDGSEIGVKATGPTRVIVLVEQ